MDMMLDFQLGETADAIRDTTRRYAADRIAPMAAEIDATNTFPRELWPEMGELGLHGMWDPLESTCRHASLSIL